jgi:hypothetical protein
MVILSTIVSLTSSMSWCFKMCRVVPYSLKYIVFCVHWRVNEIAYNGTHLCSVSRSACSISSFPSIGVNSLKGLFYSARGFPPFEATTGVVLVCLETHTLSPHQQAIDNNRSKTNSTAPTAIRAPAEMDLHPLSQQ